LKANYKQLSKFCPVGRELRQKFDEDPEPGKHRSQSKAYFEHVHDCYWCKQARKELLREQQVELAQVGILAG
jgi:hypothetical protein